jgi:2,3-bisphosphoglycerate-dependent phosphoglycerate mutase
MVVVRAGINLSGWSVHVFIVIHTAMDVCDKLCPKPLSICAQSKARRIDLTHLYLIRHADYIYDLVDGNYPKQNLGLSAAGIKEAERLRDRLVNSGELKPDLFISSTERGAHETAEIVAPALGQPITLDKDFEEWRSEDGNLSTDEFMDRWRQVSEAQKPYFRWVEGCENWLEFSLRIRSALNRVVRNHAGKTIAVMTHGAVIQVSFVYFFGLSEINFERAVPEIKRTSITHWFKPQEGNRWILERSNDYHHV